MGDRGAGGEGCLAGCEGAMRESSTGLGPTQASPGAAKCWRMLARERAGSVLGELAGTGAWMVVR